MSQMNRRSARCRAMLRAEHLERRLLLATYTWDGGGNGFAWHDAINWNPNGFPGADDDVVISVPFNPTIQFTAATGSVAIRSLTSTETINKTGGDLTLTAGASIIGNIGNGNGSGTLSHTGGTLAVTGAGTTLTADGVAGGTQR